MRFETKSLQEKRLALRRLHRFLNDMVFNNELDEDIIIDIQDINEYKDEGDIIFHYFRKYEVWIWFDIDHFPEIIGKYEKF